MARRCNVDNVHPMDFSVVHGMDTGVLHQVTFPLKDPLKIKGKGEKSLLAAFALQREQLISEMQSIWQEVLLLMNDFGRRRYAHGSCHVYLQPLRGASGAYPYRVLRWCFYTIGQQDSRQVFVCPLRDVLNDAGNSGHVFLTGTLAQMAHLPLLDQLLDAEWQRVCLNTRIRQCRNMLLVLDGLLPTLGLREDLLAGKLACGDLLSAQGNKH